MRLSLPARLAAVVVLFASVHALAQPVFLRADLNNANEPGGVTPTLSAANGGGPRPPSFGVANFVLDSRTNPTKMTMTTNIFNIDVTGTQTPDTNDNLVNAHIHASPTAGNPTFPVVWGFFGAPQNNTNPADGGVVAFPAGQVGGTFVATWDLNEGNGTPPTTLAAQAPNILAGRSYINFHTVQFGGGEIRGTLVEVPEPSTLALALGSMTLLTIRRRRA